jgi:spore germination protein
MGVIKRLLSGMLKQTDQSNSNKAQFDSTQEQNEKPSLSHTLNEFKDCMDLNHLTYSETGVDAIYFGHLVDNDKLTKEVLIPLQQVHSHEISRLLKQQPQFSFSTDTEELIIGILSGKVAIFFGEDAFLVDVYGPKARAVTQSETESVITGPHDAFTEQAGVSLSLIRNRIKSSHLKIKKLTVGEIAKTNVYILYIEDIANMDHVNEAIKRIQNIEVDAIHDTNMLIQYIDDHPYSIFPQFYTSERPDAIASKLLAGRLVGIVDGSPSAFSAPTSFFEFFSSSDDYYQRWILGTAARMLRFLAFLITTLFTAMYVSTTTYHYEMIPESLLLTLSQSRSKVPFPPVYEAFLMEMTIELLREAGARLPTKIGQTIGIVGGIVIGQAAVQAGLTSNILIIAVASSAIASFVIPSYVMSASIRIFRFGLILVAGFWGNLGIALGITALVIHMVGLKSLGTSYLNPIAPIQFRDWKDVFIRAPLQMIKTRPTQSKSPNIVRSRTKR